MSLLTPLENLIHRLDTEGAAELAAVKADVESKVAEAVPVIEHLRASVQSAVADAAEAAAPGLRAALEAAVTAAEDQLRAVLGL